MEKLTVKKIIAIEPRLNNVIEFVNKPEQKLREYYEIWSDSKVMIENLIGWCAENEKLRSSLAFDIFSDYLLELICENSKDDEEA
jgi:hypothetical protein